MLNAVSKRIDKKQIIKVHTLISALKLSDESYRQTLLHNFGVTTSKAITCDQANALIATLEEKAIEKGVWIKHEGATKYENLGNRPGMASPAQLRKIEALWRDVTGLEGREDRKKTLRAFLNKRFKVADLRFLEADRVKKVIHALEHMKMQKNGELFKGSQSDSGGVMATSVCVAPREAKLKEINTVYERISEPAGGAK